MNTLLLVTSLISFADPVPADEDVKAGWGAFALFLGLGVTVALLGWSMVRHLGKARTNRDAGAFGDEPVNKAAEDSPSDSQD